MISCDKVREILMTLYLDNELEGKQRNEVEAHLAGCSECRELETLLVKDVVGPLKETALMEPSSAVWDSIEAKISGPVKIGGVGDLFERIWRIVLRPVPVAAVSFLVAGVLIFSVFLTSVPGTGDIDVENYFSKHMRFLDYLDSNGEDYYPISDHLGIISPIEKYLF